MAIKPLGKVTDYEAGLIKTALGDLATNIEKVCMRVSRVRICWFTKFVLQGVTFVESSKL